MNSLDSWTMTHINVLARRSFVFDEAVEFISANNLLKRTNAIAPEGRPYEQFRSAGWVRAKIVGSKNVAEFLAAYHGLPPWDAWHDPRYLDTLLLAGRQRPADVVLSKAGS